MQTIIRAYRLNEILENDKLLMYFIITNRVHQNNLEQKHS